jgi:hypothetical protein
MVFIDPRQMLMHQEGEEHNASTERFYDSDIPIFLDEHEVGEVFGSGTLVKVKKGGWSNE